MEVRGRIFSLQLEHPFGIARWSHSVQPSLIVALSQDGHTGYGEATQNAYYDVTAGKLLDGLEKIKLFLENYRLEHPGKLWEQLRKHTGNFRFLMAAIDEAAWDLYGKMKGIRTFEHWGLNPQNLPVSSYTIGIDRIDVMRRKIREKPWPVYKIKLGTDHDEDIIAALRKETDAVFRIDANAAWTPEKTLRMARMMRDMNVEFIEQPLPAGAWKDMRRLRELSPLPLIADESCRTEADLENCRDAFHGINVKLTKAGGLTPGYRMLRWAREHRLLTMVGCMTESSVGISAAAQVAPLCRFADLDGPLLITNDPARGVEITPQGITYSQVAGNGVEMMDAL